MSPLSKVSEVGVEQRQEALWLSVPVSKLIQFNHCISPCEDLFVYVFDDVPTISVANQSYALNDDICLIQESQSMLSK